MQEFGKHYLVELIECDPEALSSSDIVESAMLEAAKASGATLLESAFHQFEPQGVSGFLFIAESHFSVHTWPEAAYAGVDIFTCGETMNAQAAIDLLTKAFSAKRTDVKTMPRGIKED